MASHTTSHPSLDVLYATAIAAAAELWAGSDDSDLDRNPEYLKGQVELIAQLVGSASTADPRDDIEADIRDLIAGA